MRSFITKPSAEPSVSSSSKGISMPAVPVYQAVQQPVQRVDTHHGESEKQVITTPKELKETIEEILEYKFDGVRGLFMKNDVASSQSQWADLLFEYMEGEYVLRGLDLQSIKNAVKDIKNDIRNDTLLHYTSIAYTEGVPYSVENLTEELTKLSVYLDGDDDEALDAIVETEGKFAATQVQIAPGNIQLRDEDNIVSVIDSHQNKHQKGQIAELHRYGGAPGSKFSSDKDLDWHRDNTAVTVAQITQEAIDDGSVGPDTGTFTPSKAPRDGIIYDIAITYDQATGKYVAAYHCNPVDDEDG